jgi:hypothetical protein
MCIWIASEGSVTEFSHCRIKLRYEYCIMRSLMICSPHSILFGWTNREEWDVRGTYRVWASGEGYTGFWWGNLREIENMGDPGVYGSILLRWIFRKWDEVVWPGLSWFRIGRGGGHLWMWSWTFGFHKMREISWLTGDGLASQEGLFSME